MKEKEHSGGGSCYCGSQGHEEDERTKQTSFKHLKFKYTYIRNQRKKTVDITRNGPRK